MDMHIAFECKKKKSEEIQWGNHMHTFPGLLALLLSESLPLMQNKIKISNKTGKYVLSESLLSHTIHASELNSY